jgi:RNA polymerase sigma factor (sigma-70 family)
MLPESPLPPGIERNGVFATTHWSVVMAASGDNDAALQALEKLCGIYWYPLYAHIRRKGHPPEESQDLTQDFFASLLRHDSLQTIRRERGRFRTFLLTSLNYFLSDQLDKILAQKRGGGQKLIELDALAAEERYALEPATDETPDKAFDRRWAAALVERSLNRLQAEQQNAGKGAEFDLLKVFLSRETVAGEYDQVGKELGLSPNAVAAAVRRLRLRFREFAFAEALQTVSSHSDAEDEFRCLWS